MRRRSGARTYDPNGGKEQADLDAREVGVDGRNDDVPVELGANTDAHDAKVHQKEGPQSPVEEHVRKVLEGPVLHVVDATELPVMHDGILTLEGLGGLGQPLHQAGPLPHLARGQGLVRKPPEQGDSNDEADNTVEEEHPPETLETTGPVHHLEAGGDEADDGGGQLRGGVVHADPLAGARGRVEEGQVEGHAGPHAGDDRTKKEPQEPVTWLARGPRKYRRREFDILGAPRVLNGGEAGPDDASGHDDPGHPRAGTNPAHDEVARKVKDDVRDVEQGECQGDIARRHAEHGDQVVADVLVHGLGDADVGADGGAEEVEKPES